MSTNSDMSSDSSATEKDAPASPSRKTVKSAKKRTSKPSKKKNKAATSKKAAAPLRGVPWTFPKHNLDDAIRIAKAIEDKNAGNPMPASLLATAVGYRLPQDWRFQELLRSANQYGLVDGAGPTAKVELTKLGQDVVAPANQTQRVEGLIAAFRNVRDFAEVEKFYGGKTIPDDEFFLNTLTREFHILRDRADIFSKIFTANLKYLKSFSVGERTPEVNDRKIVFTNSKRILLDTSTQTSVEPRVREFLETCFVMMPFGPWFDRYYQEIYIPAIRDAGFEPVRADELFTTGSVVEQIWEQISKAKVLLADLSGKNPNVFYELGLAHAAIKPVVFTASQVDDVPFDLRHLRVIVYEIQEPEWASKLRKNITDYLRNAAREPEKSIPHPFRALIEDTPKSVERSK